MSDPREEIRDAVFEAFAHESLTFEQRARILDAVADALVPLWREALSRQAREVVALARGAYADDPAVKRALDNFAVFIEGRFAPKEADPR